MTTEEMRANLKAAYKKFDEEKCRIIKEYLDAINPYKKGDIIQDHISKLQITHWKYRLWESEPDLVYFGTELKKDGAPIKKQSNRAVYLSNIVKTN